ncbi:hypothetical protein MBLNU13_g08991t2 [Cladosporium sp. NU13]
MGNIQEIPPEVLKSWPRPNYVDPVRRDWMPAFALVWQIASTILVWGRFYLRVRRLAGPFGYDDAFMLIAWLSSVAFTACAWYTTTYLGVDRHTWDVPVTSFSEAAKIAWILQVLMLFASGATKASVLLFYRRLVTGTLARRWKLAIYFALAFHAAYLIGLTLGYVLICRPLEAYWMSYDYNWHKEFTCASADAINPVIGVLSILSDIYAVALPFIILHYYTLDVPRAQKIGLNIIFALGLLVAGAGVGRTYYLIKLGNTYDTSWTGFDLLVWTIIEMQLGIICACAPSLRAFFRRYLSDRIRMSLTRSYQSRNRDKEPEPIDMQVLTTHSSANEYVEQPAMGPVRSMSPAYTHPSRNASESYHGADHVRWNSNGRDSPYPSVQDIETAIWKAQTTRSGV